jgi:uncharacterized protein (UPF0276 family)
MQKLKISGHSVGIGVKSVYYNRLLDSDCGIDFCEAHIENFIAGGFHLNQLKHIANQMPVTLHGVALSLGGQCPPTTEALAQRKRIIDMINPVFVSEHAACTHVGQHLNDLLPIALNQKTVKRIVQHIDKTQTYFQRQILLENLTSYVVFDDDDMHEGEFLNAIAKQSGCGLLLDVNNLYLQEYNLGRSADMFLQTIKPEYIQQYHVAGGEYNAEYDIMIDTHGTDIQSQIMDLYCKTIDKIGNRPTLYERDNNIPEFDDLLNTVQNIRQSHKAHTGGVC